MGFWFYAAPVISLQKRWLCRFKTVLLSLARIKPLIIQHWESCQPKGILGSLFWWTISPNCDDNQIIGCGYHECLVVDIFCLTCKAVASALPCLKVCTLPLHKQCSAKNYRRPILIFRPTFLNLNVLFFHFLQVKRRRKRNSRSASKIVPRKEIFNSFQVFESNTIGCHSFDANKSISLRCLTFVTFHDPCYFLKGLSDKVSHILIGSFFLLMILPRKI